ncbi:MAG: hypothetical protein KY455_07865 [Euryarchaeota archaeon]|nr:hypothetical protein [Euryarchaeota archaeon]
MARTATSTTDWDKVIGIISIILGVLVLIGELSFTGIVPFIGILLIVLGILMFVNIVRGSNLVAAGFVVLGILLAVNFLNIPGTLARVLDLVVGVALIVYGIFVLK